MHYRHGEVVVVMCASKGASHISVLPLFFLHGVIFISVDGPRKSFQAH